MRYAEIERKTKETDVKAVLRLDGGGNYKIDTGSGFLDHMLELFASHGGFDLEIKCAGDVGVDFHHSAEDVGIALGSAFYNALGDKRGINRYGNSTVPMDEALILAAVDLSGRDILVYGLDIPSPKIGQFDTELLKEFFTAFTRSIKAAVHIKQLCGENSHHIAEGAFKALARALKQASELSGGDKIPSTKGIL